MKRAEGAGTAKTLEKLEKSVHAGNYYEAQQMYKTVYARYMGAKKYTDAMDLLQSGASIQLRHGQVTCGVELGVLLIETFAKAQSKFEISYLDRIKSILNEFPRSVSEELEVQMESDSQRTSEAYVESKTRVDGFSTLVKAAIKWCIDSGGPSRGPAELHDILAEYIWTQSPKMEMGKVSLHFVRGNHPETHAAALVDYIQKCGPEEADLVVARGVLLYLSSGNLRDANRLMYEVKHGLSNEDFPNTPLMHFIKYLLLTLERDALPLFRMLRENYKSSIGRDSLLDECLDAIAERFYNVHRRNGLQGMLGDILKMFASETNS